MNYHTEKNQEICGKLVAREVIYCASTLVHEISQKAEEFPDYYDDILNAYRGMPDYEEAAIQEGWQETNDGEFHHKENGKTIRDWDASDWQELCEAEGIEPHETEIYEHWIVTDWFGAKLEAHGERVLSDFFGLTIWCRGCSGQAIKMDHVIGQIAENMEILEGQRNVWSA
jgi:hypothetical protein